MATFTQSFISDIKILADVKNNIVMLLTAYDLKMLCSH